MHRHGRTAQAETIQAQPYAGKPKAASHSDFRRSFTLEQRNNTVNTSNIENTARSAVPEHPHERIVENSTRNHSTVTNDNGCHNTVTDSCETVSPISGTKRKHRKAQCDSIRCMK